MIRRMFIRTKHDSNLNRTRVQIVESVRTGKKVRQKILRHVGVAHNDGEIEVIKRSARQLMEQLRADRTPQKELFSPGCDLHMVHFSHMAHFVPYRNFCQG